MGKSKNWLAKVVDAILTDFCQYKYRLYEEIDTGSQEWCYPYQSWIIPTRLDEGIFIRLKRI